MAYLKAQELLLLGPIDGKHVLAEKNDFFQCVLHILVFLDYGNGLIDVRFVVRLRLDEFVEVKTICVHFVNGPGNYLNVKSGILRLFAFK